MSALLRLTAARTAAIKRLKRAENSARRAIARFKVAQGEIAALDIDLANAIHAERTGATRQRGIEPAPVPTLPGRTGPGPDKV
jgi:hypothetical protein